MADGHASLSMLDVITDEYKKAKEHRTSRLMISAELITDKGTLDDIQRFHKDVFSSFSDNESRATGILLTINNVCMVHLVEAPTKVLLALLRALSKEKVMFKNARVCSFSEELPREYRVWAARSTKTAEEEVLPKDWSRVIFGTLKGLLELAREVLPSMSEEKSVEFLATSTTKGVMSRMPSAQRVLSFAHCEDLCSVPEFLDIYDKPIDFTLESEKVWPVEPFLKY